MRGLLQTPQTSYFAESGKVVDDKYRLIPERDSILWKIAFPLFLLMPQIFSKS